MTSFGVSIYPYQVGGGGGGGGFVEGAHLSLMHEWEKKIIIILR